MWRGYPVEGYYNTCWQTGLWSTQAKVQGSVLKAAWQLRIDSSVVNNPLGEPGCTSLYVGLLSLWGSVCLHMHFFTLTILKLTACFLFLAIIVSKQYWYCSQKLHSYTLSFLHTAFSHNYTKLNVRI